MKERTSAADTKASAALTALKTDFGVKDLAAVLEPINLKSAVDVLALCDFAR